MVSSNGAVGSRGKPEITSSKDSANLTSMVSRSSGSAGARGFASGSGGTIAGAGDRSGVAAISVAGLFVTALGHCGLLRGSGICRWGSRVETLRRRSGHGPPISATWLGHRGRLGMPRRSGVDSRRRVNGRDTVAGEKRHKRPNQQEPGCASQQLERGPLIDHPANRCRQTPAHLPISHADRFVGVKVWDAGQHNPFRLSCIHVLIPSPTGRFTFPGYRFRMYQS